MDIDLLSKMIAELIVDHDTVGLPGVGTFYTEVVPSTFSDRGYTINPPYRRLSFLPNAVENDLLVNFYSDVNGTPADMAREYIVQFLRELAEALKEHKTITLPGLGRLRATKENNFFFVADEDLDIYPEAFGLAPVSLKNIPGLDDDKVDIRFEFKPPVRKAEKPGPAEPGPSVSAERPGPAEPEPAKPEPSLPAEPLSATAPEAVGLSGAASGPASAEPSAAAAGPVFGAGTSADAKTAADTETAADAKTAAMQETASESAAGTEVSSGTDATAEPAGTAVTAEPAVAVERAASAEPAAAAEPEAEAPEAAVAGEGAAEPSVAVERAVSAEAVVLPESASGPETAEPAAAGPEASVPEPEAEAPKAAVAGEGAAEPAEPGALANCAEETRVVEEDDGQTGKKLPSAERIPAPVVEEDDGRTVKKFRWWIPLLVLSALAAVFLAVFLILAHVAPDFIDSILYTPEELRIINY